MWHVGCDGVTASCLNEMDAWAAHQLRGRLPTEAWIAFFGHGTEFSSLIVSGGDDALMKGWDIRQGGGGSGKAAFVVKDHGAGVTTGQWHPSVEHVFARCAWRQLCASASFTVAWCGKSLCL